jgi:hypothetical protein
MHEIKLKKKDKRKKTKNDERREACGQEKLRIKN